MAQNTLFGEAAYRSERRVTVRVRPAFASWQAQARRLLQAGTPPGQVWWQPEEPDPGTACTMPLLEAEAADECAVPSPAAGSSPASGSSRASMSSRAGGSSPAPGITVPRAFLEQARAAACHSAADRWALLYEILWRLVGDERHLMQLHGDPQVIRLNAYAKSVLRDFHKMKAFVRFRGMKDPQWASSEDLRYVAWFEPTHHIVEHASPFFRRRFANMRWSILTPDRCAHYEGEGEVWFSQGVDRAAAPSSDALEEVWLMYYRSIFNPARLKVRAMLSEMPQKYWKNLPEAQLIPSLVRDANQRSADMQAHRRTMDEPRCGPRPMSPGEQLAKRLASAGPGTLQHLALEARSCRRCPLWEAATQTVWGEGPDRARIMLVGEQPGDREDLTGRPFVGPAGQLLDRALAEAGLDRRSLYLTNTVKHFKFKSRGKRRIHEKPSDAEALACLPWLQAEISRIRPTLLVCVGATAARALLGRAVKVNLERGRVMEGADAYKPMVEGPALLLTFHPSYLLRLEQGSAAAGAYAQFVADLRLAKTWSETNHRLPPPEASGGRRPTST